MIDYYGCVKEQTYTLIEYPTIDIASTVVDNQCSEANIASIDITASGGNPANYSYQWFKNGTLFDPLDSLWTTTQLNSLTSGFYTVIVEDEQGCQAEKSFEITSPDVLQTKETIVDNVCNGDSNGSITTQAFGGTGPYNYSWKKAGVIIGTGTSLSNLSAGSYQLTVTDNNGCTPLVKTISVIEPSTTFAIGFTTTDLTCFESIDGAVALTITAPGHPTDYDISWYKNDEFYNSEQGSLINLPSAEYKVVLRDAYGCTKTDSVIVTQPDDINLNPVIDPLVCYNASTASLTLALSGGSGAYPSIKWYYDGLLFADGALTASNLSSGDYQLVVTDTKSCVKDTVITIVNPADITFST